MPFKFNYRSGDIRGIHDLNYSRRTVSVKKILDDLFSGTSLRYQQMQYYIIIKKSNKQAGQQVTVFGFAKSAHSGETLQGASVLLSGSKTWSAITNAYGFYSVTVPAGSYHISCSYVGYRDVEQVIDCRQTFQNNIELVVKEDNNLQPIARGMIANQWGNFVLTGNTDSKDGDVSLNLGGASDIWVVYAGASGSKTWEKTFGGPKDNYSCCITAGTEGRFIVGGYSNSVEGETSNNKGGV